MTTSSVSDALGGEEQPFEEVSLAEGIAAIILGREPAVSLVVEGFTDADFAEAAFIALAERGVRVVERKWGVAVSAFDRRGFRTPIRSGDVRPLLASPPPISLSASQER